VNGSPAFLIQPFPEWAHRVRAAFTLRHGGGGGTGAYSDLNLGFRAGDEPALVSGNWKTVLAAAGLEGKPLVIPRMVHGDGLADGDGPWEAVPVSDPEGAEGAERAEGKGATGARLSRFEPDGADAVWARTPGRVHAVTMADCLTALVFDPACGTVAAVHAGWRGTQAHILEKTLRRLIAAGDFRAESTLVALGPCLTRETLEVGEELAGRLEKEFVVRRDGRFHFDMPASNRAQALACGIPASNLREMGGDTRLEPERYFSYRRDGQASGRMAAFISLL
jgi:purine-nucleoside/S-methyl-5'-thioadenosine phosphorylase / adenosine deaminase